MAEAGLALGTDGAGWAKVEPGDVSAEAAGASKVRSKKEEGKSREVFMKGAQDER